jgi:NADH dehydrogenase FAD-containing subunit
MLGGRYGPEELVFPLRERCAAVGARYVEASAVDIDCRRRRVTLSDGTSLRFEVLSCNVGSVVDCGEMACGASVFTAKPIRNLLVAGRRTERLVSTRPANFVVVGGGAAAVEIAGNLARLLRRLAAPGQSGRRDGYTNAAESSVTLVPGPRPLHQFSSRVKALVNRELGRSGVSVGPSAYAVRAADDEIVCEDGTVLPADLTILATGVTTPPLFRDSGLPTAAGGELLVDDRLQSVGCEGVFGVGDCVQPERGALAKVGVYAVRQTPVLVENLVRFLEGRELQTFTRSGKYLLLLNLGTERGVFIRGRVSLSGRWALRLKDRIDRSYARTYAPSSVG